MASPTHDYTDVDKVEQVISDNPNLGQMAEDPWIHRAARMRCHTCMYWVQKMNGGPPRPVVGRCRRRAPTMNGFPVAYPEDWCGDHKIDETK